MHPIYRKVTLIYLFHATGLLPILPENIKDKGFLVFSWGKERDQWHDTGHLK